MQKAIIFRAYNGAEIIDPRPEAEIAYENMRYAEELASKRKKRNNKPHKSFAEILSALLQEVNMVKGYTVPNGYMGWLQSEMKYQLFATENDYLEYILLKEELS